MKRKDKNDNRQDRPQKRDRIRTSKPVGETEPTRDDQVPPDSGLYLLLLRLEAPVRLTVGALGRFSFPAGWYVYTGSAKRNMYTRLERHFATRKQRRWHIDHLTTTAFTTPVGAVMFNGKIAEEGECALNRRIGALLGLVQFTPGFGASDCTSGCGSHLWYTARPVSLLQLAGAAPGASYLLPSQPTGEAREA